MMLAYFGYIVYKSSNSNTKTGAKQRKLQNWTVNVTQHSDKPIIFIIVDEYASPAVFEKANIIKKNPDLADYLDSTGWVTKKQSYSAEISTIHSISSIFNNNLSKEGAYSNTGIIAVSEDLKKASIIKDLTARKVSFKNYSFFTITNHPYYTYLYVFPPNFI